MIDVVVAFVDNVEVSFFVGVSIVVDVDDLLRDESSKVILCQLIFRIYNNQINCLI